MDCRYKAVLFDLDGTLMDTSSGILAALRKTISELNLKALGTDVLQTFIGPPVQMSFARVYGMTKKDADQVAAVFRGYYKQPDYLLQAIPYEGIFEVLDALSQKHIKIAVATYKRQDYAENLLNHAGFNKYTDVFYGADFEGKLTKSDIILKCIADCGIADHSDVLMVGDTFHDAVGAQNLNIPFLGVTYGFGFSCQEEIEKFPNAGCANTPLEILNYV